MLSSLSVLLLAAGANALVSRGGSCCFELTAQGGPGGPVEQLFDGQNRIGQKGLPQGTYCIDGSGGITDGQGRGCILTPPTQQWQCDEGATPTPGFSVNCDGLLEYPNSDVTYTCPTEDNGGWNIYGKQIQGEPRCTSVQLHADKCSSCHPAPQPKPQPQPQPHPQCPADLSNEYTIPHFIVPISQSKPNTAYGTQFNGTINADVSTIYAFDIPPDFEGKTCNLIFLLPSKEKLETSSYEYSGSGGFDFYLLGGSPTKDTTYNNAPQIQKHLGTFDVHPDSAFSVLQWPCPAHQQVAFEAGSAGSSLEYFQDFNPAPIGAYVTTC